MGWVLDELAHLFRSAIIHYPGGTMKGPFERLKYDLRRLWECPRCKRRERSDGTVTTRFCTCPGQSGSEGKRTAMKLVEEAGHRAVPKFTYCPIDDVIPDAAPVDALLPPETVAPADPPADA